MTDFRRLALITLAETAIRVGHAHAWLRGRIGGLYGRLRARQGWKSQKIGPIEFSTPANWGDVEPAGMDGYVIHNQPDWARVDGDAVWYGNAVEIRFEPADRRPPGAAHSNQAMSEESRTLRLDDQTVIATMRIANGVGPHQRRIARRVFGSVRVTSPECRLVFPAPGRGAADAVEAHAASEGEPRVALDFIRHFADNKRPQGSRMQ